ncbi:MAG: esterase family protein [Anaerotruncus sp.]|nr:esterase family protein [Anaerotruncus sp.]
MINEGHPVIRRCAAALLLRRGGSSRLCPSLAAGPAAGQAVAEGLTLRSQVLGRDVAYAVYLPPDYAASARRYPVVYLLHGYTDDESGWIQFGEVGGAADAGHRRGRDPPMIIVMPDGGVTWYIERRRRPGPLGGHVRPGAHPPHRRDLPDAAVAGIPRHRRTVDGRLGDARPFASAIPSCSPPAPPSARPSGRTTRSPA